MLSKVVSVTDGVYSRPTNPRIQFLPSSRRRSSTSILDIPPRTEWGVVKLNMSGTLSKDLLDQGPLRVVSQLPHSYGCFAVNQTVDEAGPQVKVKTKVYQEILKDATPSEEAVRLLLTP